ncbi:aminoglycoside phosphotransferase family protein [Streptomyces sp. TRM49041]|uniref:phosphotransferase family protein n=1 Tax=Streptomyces sp. TRM49041 TaxID=2603216 RepID=UPI0021CCC2E6|nr:aminoglycoside phosphotransferase family protein [Streptomyces sp. TRM49041]
MTWGGGTRRWVEKHLDGPADRIESVERLRGGWTAEMRRVRVAGGAGAGAYDLVLRSFVKPFFVRHAEGLLNREAAVLRLLTPTDVPVAELRAVDATAAHCEYPSLLMSLLPGSVRVAEDGGAGGHGGHGGHGADDGDGEAGARAALLARQLAGIHRVEVPEAARPRAYQAWTAPDRVRIPEGTARRLLWERAVDVIRRDPPPHTRCFLHRDFHPGNVLFTGTGAGLRITGVVDWVETSWGPADLDVAHCSTALALLHGTDAGMGFADLYAESGGALSPDPASHLYWRLLDALAYAPDAEKVALPWRELGRTDLTPQVLTERLETYLEALLTRYGPGA